MSTFTKLQKEFENGTVPKDLDGFYKGKLELLVPENKTERFGQSITKYFLPWKGKKFSKKDSAGINRVTLGFHLFPFKTSVTKGLHDNIKVLQLDYDLPGNPTVIRRVVDELVEVSKNTYLGKAYVKKGKSTRLFAFFGLTLST